MGASVGVGVGASVGVGVGAVLGAWLGAAVGASVVPHVNDAQSHMQVDQQPTPLTVALQVLVEDAHTPDEKGWLELPHE